MSIAANSRLMSAPAQDQDRLAAQRKFEEGKALDDQGTAESLRLAVKKYEEALSLWRAVGDRRSEAITINNIGLVYNSLGDNQKALDFKDPDDRRRTAREFARSLKEAVEKPPPPIAVDTEPPEQLRKPFLSRNVLLLTTVLPLLVAGG